MLTTQINPVFESLIISYLKRTGFERITPKAALIDMDGTLYDSMPSHAMAWHRLMAEYGINCPPEEFLLYEGMTGEATIRHLFRRDLNRDVTSEEAKRIYRKKTEYFAEMPAVEVMPGAADMLMCLREHDITCVLVTGSGQHTVIDRIQADFPGIFAPGMMVTSRDVTRGKPHPEPYLKGMSLAEVRPEEAIVIENAPLGVKAGVDSEAFTIGITTGPLPATALIEAGADIIFPSMPNFARSLPSLLDDIRRFTED